MTRRTREDYEELGRLVDAAEEAVGRVQGMIMYMFSTLDEENRQLPTRYDEKALAITLALGELRDELDLERRGDMPAYLDALRELMRSARREARRERAGAA